MSVVQELLALEQRKRELLAQFRAALLLEAQSRKIVVTPQRTPRSNVMSALKRAFEENWRDE